VSFIVFLSTITHRPPQNVIKSADVPPNPPDARPYSLSMLIDGSSRGLCACFEEDMDEDRFSVAIQRIRKADRDPGGSPRGVDLTRNDDEAHKFN
jgi:hypothetical protein